MGYTEWQALGHLSLGQKGAEMRIEIDGRKFVARKPKGMNTDGY